MTNTSFRKKALLSSVAMLIVALIALGSATFAWFSANTTATASGLTIKTSASNGVVLDAQYDGNDEYTHNETLHGGQNSDPYTAGTVNLAPQSLDLTAVGTTSSTLTWSQATATADGTYSAGDGTEVTHNDPISGHTVYFETINAKATGTVESGSEPTLKLASIGVTAGSGTYASNLANAVRIAVVYNGDLKAVYAPAAADDTAKYIKGSVATGANAKYWTAATTGDNAHIQTVFADGDLVAYNTQTSLGSLHDTGSDVIGIYVYLDGEDTNCVTNNVTTDLSAIVSNITFNFTIA